MSNLIGIQPGECMLVRLPREQIVFDLSGYQLRLVASQMTEDGYLLLLEGDEDEVGELVQEWGELCEVQ